MIGESMLLKGLWHYTTVAKRKRFFCVGQLAAGTKSKVMLKGNAQKFEFVLQRICSFHFQHQITTLQNKVSKPFMAFTMLKTDTIKGGIVEMSIADIQPANP
jgi:hypothetical protein